MEPPYAAAGRLLPLYAATDWEATPLGPAHEWSPVLRGALAVVLGTRFPATLFWGPDLLLLYNDAYARLIADKHPAALGEPLPVVFPEAWEQLEPHVEHVLAGRGATWMENALVPLERRGFLEECFFTYSYSPVQGPDGTVEGVLDIATETTEQVHDRRRLRLLADLRDVLGDAEDEAQVLARALPVLRGAAGDLPLADLRGAGERGDPALPAVPSRPLGPSGSLLLDEGPTAWVPLADGEPGQRPLLVVRLSDALALDPTYLDLLRLVGGVLVQALAAAGARRAERERLAVQQGLSESLQRSLLTRPARTDGLEVAVRYRPAAAEVQVGGDWYDAFPGPESSTTLVVGDVTGHDRRAAAVMGQLRNLLRGVAHALGDVPPSRVLSGLDRALADLGVDTLATAVVARLHRHGGGAHLRLSSAGHLPALVVRPDGACELLRPGPDLLLGLDPDAERTDLDVVLPPGAVLLLFTDGLVERRGEDLDAGLARLTAHAPGLLAGDLEGACDALLELLVPDPDDDLALLAVRSAQTATSSLPIAGSSSRSS